METMMKFKRLTSICDDETKILEAVKSSTNGLMEVDIEGKRLRRNPEKAVPEFNEERKKELAKMTVYVKGFDKENSELEELISFFNDKCGNDVINVAMRNFHDKKSDKRGFKGSVFVTFSTREAAEKFMNDDSEIRVKANDEEPLTKKWQEDYFADKAKEIEERKSKNKKDKQKLKDAQAESEKAESGDKKDEGLPKGTVLVVDGLNEETMREDIKEVLKEKYECNTDEAIGFVYYQKGEPQAKLRFKEENAAVEVLKKITDGKMEVKGKEVTVKCLEGEEEETFLAKCLEDMKNRGRQNKGHKRKHGGRGGGRGGKRGRR